MISGLAALILESCGLKSVSPNLKASLDDLAALFREGLDEELRETLGVVIRHIIENGGLGKLEDIISEAGCHGSLIGIDEAYSEVERFDLAVYHSNLGVSCHCGDVGHLHLLEHRGDGDRVPTGVRPYDAHDLVLAGKTPHGIHALHGVPSVVISNYSDLGA